MSKNKNKMLSMDNVLIDQFSFDDSTEVNFSFPFRQVFEFEQAWLSLDLGWPGEMQILYGWN